MTPAEAKQMLMEVVGINDIPMSKLGTVKSVDETNKTCVVTPIDEGPDFVDVLLMAENSTTGLYIKPSVGSLVMIAPQNECTYYVSMYSSIDDIWIRGNSNGGVPITSSVVTKLNNLEEDLNKIKMVFSTIWTPVSNDGGAALKAAAATWAGQTLTQTIADDLQSTTVKHG